ncbi:MAG: DegT/DnrJ/EryC1/StrS family aminotransferase [Saprospiraceae bacterium]|nr:DegT/DnrJ/EryC1/StrS family aminotransferase [Saprospiraceae bacterium]
MQIVTANRARAILFGFIRNYANGKYLLPANVCPIVPLTFKKANVDFEFIDINNKTLCIDEETVLKKISDNSSEFEGIVFVHTYGALKHVHNFFNQIKAISTNFKIIDDRCLCFPDTEIKDMCSDLMLYSTGYGKTIDLGQGAFAYLKEGLYVNEEVQNYSEYDLEKLTDDYKFCLQNRLNISNKNYNWLDTKLNTIDKNKYFQLISQKVVELKTHKEKINAIYNSNLSDHIKLDSDFNNWRYNIVVNNKDEILRRIFDAGLFASSHYVPSSVLFSDVNYFEAELLSQKIINLFNDKSFSEQQAENICKIINGVV